MTGGIDSLESIPGLLKSKKYHLSTKRSNEYCVGGG
jgi:hypothetical protein